MRTIQLTKIFPAIFAGAILGMAVSCSEKEPVVYEYITPDISSYTIDCHGEEFTIAVKSDGEWEFQGGAEWITINQTETGLEFSAQANETGQIRSIVVSLYRGENTAKIELSQLYTRFDGQFVEFRNGEYGYQSVFSVNGNYCGGYVGEAATDGSTLFVPVIISTTTGKVTRLPGNADYKSLRAVSDDGRMMSVAVGSIGCALLVDGKITEIPAPSGYENPVVEGFSADGTIMVGYVKNSSGYDYHPVKWTNMNPELLDIPELDMQDDELFSGAMARGCSADGSVVYGSEWDTFSMLYWDDEGMHYAGKETSETRDIDYMGMSIPMPAYMKKTAERYSISPNGRYIAGTFTDWAKDETGTYQPYTTSYPAIYDTQTAELTVFFDYEGHSGMAADNNGNLFGGVAGLGYVYKDSVGVPVSEWLMQNYGLVCDDDRYILNVSDDGNRLGGWRAVMNASSQTLFLGWYFNR